MTGADRAWAAQYREGDVIRYTKGSHQLGIKPGEYGTVREVDARQNTLKVEFSGQQTRSTIRADCEAWPFTKERNEASRKATASS